MSGRLVAVHGKGSCGFLLEIRRFCDYHSLDMPAFPARLHVLLARDARLGVVIRRGPSRSVCTLLWDRKTDKFQLGQWMRGRIYERRSDLSPDGKHLIYFAMNGR